MDLTAALWVFVTVVAFIFAVDAAVWRVVRLRSAPTFARRPVTRFAVMMFLFGLATGGVAIYEILA
ncbi:MAG TPA: hypothetical protein VKZ61_05580 [Thermomicrobiales bacterium]|jgi:hypothetical protein|nr:hypothetical protein [Thermomicrobiales bacterium]